MEKYQSRNHGQDRDPKNDRKNPWKQTRSLPLEISVFREYDHRVVVPIPIFQFALVKSHKRTNVYEQKKVIDSIECAQLKRVKLFFGKSFWKLLRR